MRKHRDDGPDLHQAQPVPHRDRRGGADPAHAWAAPRSTSRNRGPQFVSVEDTVCAVHASQGSVEPVSHRAAVRGGHRQPAGASTLWATRSTPTGPASRRTTTSSATTSPGSCPAARTTTSRSARRAASSCRTVPATRAPSPPRPARPMLTVNELEPSNGPAGRLILQTHALPRPVQHHHLRPQRPLPRHQEGPRCGLRQPGGHRRARPRRRRSTWTSTACTTDGAERVLRKFRVVSYPTARGLRGRLLSGGQRAGAAEPYGRRQQHPVRRRSSSGWSRAWTRRPRARQRPLPGWPHPRLTTPGTQL